MPSTTRAVEDYLKTIYSLCAEGERASTTRIAEALQVAPASVTGMLRKLAEMEPPLVVYHKHRGATLTPEGERAAIEIVRHHRLLETFLHDVLGYAWDEVHEEADRLEHVISETFEERIAEVLGNPARDPHGDPIPSRDLEVPPRTLTRLADLRPPQCAVVVRVNDADPALLRHLGEYGLLPQTRFTVVRYTPYDETISLRVEGTSEMIALGPRTTRQVFVRVESGLQTTDGGR
ncbi:MAG TPA: metal-dependent transcriptional regulator [Chloroflexi bacterium]|nr:metal-dependent transcriptional regulator [Chloroflexota bacterium]